MNIIIYELLKKTQNHKTTLAVPNVKYSGALTYPDHLGPSRGLLWVTFTFNYSSEYRLSKDLYKL
jgi:hypothetical protein